MSQSSMIDPMFCKQKLANIANIINDMEMKLKDAREARGVTASPKDAESKTHKLELENQRLLKLIQEHETAKLQMEKTLQDERDKPEKPRKEFETYKTQKDRQLAGLQKVIYCRQKGEEADWTRGLENCTDSSFEQHVYTATIESLKNSLDEEKKEHMKAKSVIEKLSRENQRLKDSAQVTSYTSSSYHDLRLERENYKNLMNAFKEQKDECLSLEEKNKLLSLRIEELTGEKVKVFADAGTETLGLAAPEFAELQQLTTKLEVAELSRAHLLNQLDESRECQRQMSDEKEAMESDLSSCECNNSHLKKQNFGLTKQLNKEKRIKDEDEQRRNKQMRKDAEEKKRLESLVEKLRTELKVEKEKRESEVKTLEREREEERKVFKETVEKCVAAYRKKQQQ